MRIKQTVPAEFLTREDGTDMRLLCGPWKPSEYQMMGAVIEDLQRSYLQWKTVRLAGCYWIYRQCQGYKVEIRGSNQAFKQIQETKHFKYKPSPFRKLLRELERKPLNISAFCIR